MGKPNSIHGKIKKYEVLVEQGRAEEALNLARQLSVSHKDCAISFNILGHALVNFQSVQNLPEALVAYARARSLAPNCMDTLKRYCLLVAKLGRPQEAADELNKARTVLQPDDPLENQPAVHIEYRGLLRAEDRIKALKRSLPATSQLICAMHVKYVMEEENAAVRLRKAVKLANSQSYLVSAHHKHVYASLMFAHHLKPNLRCDIIRTALERTLVTAKNVTVIFGSSLVMCICLSKILCVLGKYEDAVTECLRGLEIKDPSDPRSDDLTGNPSDAINSSTYESCVRFVRWQLEMLLNYIAKVCKAYWSSMRRSKNVSILKVGIEYLYDYYKETPLVVKAFETAVNFYMKKKSWKFWFCPIPKCRVQYFLTPTLLWDHICEKHKDQVIDSDVELICPAVNLGCDKVRLQDEDQHLVLILSGSQDMFNCFPHLPCKEDLTFDNTQQNKSREGIVILTELKETLNVLPSDTSTNEFREIDRVAEQIWLHLFETCSLDYLEFVLPFIRKYQLSEVLKWMAEDKSNIGRFISPVDIESMFLGVPGAPDYKGPVNNMLKSLSYGSDVQETIFLDYLSDISVEASACEMAGFEEPTGLSITTSMVPEAIPMVIAPLNCIALPVTHDPEEFFEIENDKRLVIFDKKVPVKGNSKHPRFYYALISDEHSQSTRTKCVVGHRKSQDEVSQSFELLNKCEHPNILKPFGVWDWGDESSGLIIFPYLDGTISTIPSSHLFIEDEGVFVEFTDGGYQALSELFSAVHYVNVRYSSEGAAMSSGDGISLPLLPLRLSVDRIFYIESAANKYHLLIGDTESRSQYLIDANLEDIVNSNWNALGNSIESLLHGCVIDMELRHLLDSLKKPTVNYEDLLWEPGLWDIRVKMFFIREIFWCLESDQSKVFDLQAKAPLGIEAAASALGYACTSPNLYWDFTFLRNKVLAHQDDPYHTYSGPKENIGDQKATIEKFVRKRAPDYMLNLIKEIRQLNWIKVSPLLRSKTDYMKYFKSALESTNFVLNPTAAEVASGLAQLQASHSTSPSPPT